MIFVFSYNSLLISPVQDWDEEIYAQYCFNYVVWWMLSHALTFCLFTSDDLSSVEIERVWLFVYPMAWFYCIFLYMWLLFGYSQCKVLPYAYIKCCPLLLLLDVVMLDANGILQLLLPTAFSEVFWRFFPGPHSRLYEVSLFWCNLILLLAMGT